MAEIAPPPLQDLCFEGLRTAWALLQFRDYLLAPDVKRPLNKVPIVVAPGFCAPNITTRPLRRFFESAGHPTYTPNISINHGGERIVRAVHDAIERAADTHGKKPVAVGHSLGGAVCLLVAYREATLGHIYTLGSPLHTVMGKGGANVLLASLHNGLRLFDEWSKVAHQLCEHMHAGPPPGVTLTAYRAKGDGIVAGDAAAHPWNGLTINVSGSHCGLLASEEAAGHIISSLSERPVRYRNYRRSPDVRPCDLRV